MVRAFTLELPMTPSLYFLAVTVVAVGTATRADRQAPTPAPPTDLTDYVGKADPTFAWKRAGKSETAGGTAYLLDLTSQTWHDIVWTHKLQVFLPKGVKPTATVVLWNQGGRPGPQSELLGLTIAAKVGAPVCFLYGVPNQPLFGGKTEDALIAETFVRYLESGDGSWPLLFPMVKSVVRAMDAVQAFARDEWQQEVTGFVVTGASKRGWTSWLTAATGDKRVKAIAPLVIDTLNMPEQMKNQVRAFGKPSLEIKDYTDRGLVPIPDTPAAKKLWTMIDPYVYREKITVPKLLVFGTNDPYWPLDALNSYWDELKGPKWVLYVPNAGHDLREVDEKGKKQLIPERAVNTLSAFCKCVIFDQKMPEPSWTYEPRDGGLSAAVAPVGTSTAMTTWQADAPTRDFRPVRWTPTGGSYGGGKVVVGQAGGVAFRSELRPPAEGFRAGFVETQFEVDGLTFPLSTQIRILEAKK